MCSHNYPPQCKCTLPAVAQQLQCSRRGPWLLPLVPALTLHSVCGQPFSAHRHLHLASTDKCEHTIGSDHHNHLTESPTTRAGGAPEAQINPIVTKEPPKLLPRWAMQFLVSSTLDTCAKESPQALASHVAMLGASHH